MEEVLQKILEELQNQDSTPWWLEVLRIIGPLVGGALVAAIGFFAVHQQNKTQRETIKLTTAAEADERRRERLTKWRQERYGELLTAFGEFHAAVRRMNFAMSIGSPGQVAQDEMKAAAKSVLDARYSGRIQRAAMQVANQEVAELAQQLADEYYGASRQLVALGTNAKLPDDEEALRDAYLAIENQMDESNERRYDLNRMIEQLISAGD